MYKAWKSGNTIIRKRIRQHKSNDIRQRISTYLIPISKDYFSKDTRLFTASKKLLMHLSVRYTVSQALERQSRRERGDGVFYVPPGVLQY